MIPEGEVVAGTARAANITGISTQVPMRIAYQTDGRSRKIRMKPSSPDGQGYEIVLRRTSEVHAGAPRWAR